MPTTDSSSSGESPRKRGRPRKGTPATTPPPSASKERGRPKESTEQKVKRNFNFKKSIDDLLKAEAKRTKKSANTIVEEALKATIEPIMGTMAPLGMAPVGVAVKNTHDLDIEFVNGSVGSGSVGSGSVGSGSVGSGDATGTSFAAPRVAQMSPSETQDVVKQALEAVLQTRWNADFNNLVLASGSHAEGVVVELPTHQLRVLDELAKRWNFDEPGDLLRCLAIGTINHPDHAHQLMFSDVQNQKQARREESLPEEDARKETRLRAA